MNNESFYLESKLGKLLLKFSLPCVLSLLISSLYNIVDQIFIGNSSVGSIGNTATTIIFPLTCIALAFALCLGDGTAAYMSLCHGRKEHELPKKAVGTSLTVSLIISILFLIISSLLLDKIVVLFGASTDEAINKSIEYGRIIIYGVPFFIIGTMLGSIIRADGNPKGAMIAMVSGAITNIILDYIFIFPLSMGLTGAALATIIGQFFTFSISIFYLLKSKTFHLSLKDLKIDFYSLGQLVKLGLSSFLTQISIVIISAVSMNMLAEYGKNSKYGIDDPQAIVGVAMKVFSIFVNIAVGIAAGAQPIVGYNYGAKKAKRVKELYKLIIISVFIVGLAATLLFQLAPGFVISIFGSNTTNPTLYKEFGCLTIRIYLSLIIFTLIQKATSIFLQSIGSPVKSTLLSLIRDVISFVPATIIVPMLMNNILGVLLSAPIADIFGISFSIIFILIEWKKLTKMEKENEIVNINN